MTLGSSHARATNVHDREAVMERLEGFSFINGAEPCGPGIIADKYTDFSGNQRTETFTGLLEEAGWYVAAYQAKDSGDVVTLMPLPEVSES
jgi:hypothetical protein